VVLALVKSNNNGHIKRARFLRRREDKRKQRDSERGGRLFPVLRLIRRGSIGPVPHESLGEFLGSRKIREEKLRGLLLVGGQADTCRWMENGGEILSVAGKGENTKENETV